MGASTVLLPSFPRRNDKWAGFCLIGWRSVPVTVCPFTMMRNPQGVSSSQLKQPLRIWSMTSLSRMIIGPWECCIFVQCVVEKWLYLYLIKWVHVRGKPDSSDSCGKFFSRGNQKLGPLETKFDFPKNAKKCRAFSFNLSQLRSQFKLFTADYKVCTIVWRWQKLEFFFKKWCSTVQSECSKIGYLIVVSPNAYLQQGLH